MKYSEIESLRSPIKKAPERLPDMDAIAAENRASGGFMWDKDTLKAFGDRLSNWRPKRGSDGRLYVQRNGAGNRGAPCGAGSAYELRGVEEDGGVTTPITEWENILKLSNK